MNIFKVQRILSRPKPYAVDAVKRALELGVMTSDVLKTLGDVEDIDDVLCTIQSLPRDKVVLGTVT